MKCYYQEIKHLEQKMTFKEVEDHISKLKAQLYSAMFDSSKTISVEEILKVLNLVKKLLLDHFNGLYMEDLETFIDKIRIFKTHFATLDIRQNHAEHEKTITQIFKNENQINTSLNELSKQDLISILVHENFTVHPDQFEEDIIKDTIQTIVQIRSIQEKNGEDGCNRYVISNSEDIFSVLYVFALLRWCGWKEDRIPVDIVPLFESIDGMAHAESIMQTLFSIPEYRSHLRYRGNTQTIMLGFSDGTKDGGYLQANWSIFKTKEVLSAVCDQHKIKAVFFDGRGGPPARGGWKDASILCLPKPGDCQSCHPADHPGPDNYQPVRYPIAFYP